MSHKPLLAALLLSLCPAVAPAQPLPPPPHGPCPLLYLHFGEPAGMHVTFYQGRALPRTLIAPFTVGLRPGYCYAIKLSDIPCAPGVELYPTLEVYGNLQLPPPLSVARFPAPFTLGELDIDRAFNGTMTTKVVYLEDPEHAVPAATRPDEPLAETYVPLNSDVWQEARELGRPMLVWRLGERQLSEEELLAHSVYGTILFPGEKAMAAPALPPCVPWSCVPWFDPLLGPKPPTEECMHDGGDIGTPAGVDRNGQLQGVDPSDTVAAYSDNRGQRRVVASNRVCLCVPRFGVLRCEVPLVRTASVTAPNGLIAVQTQNRLAALLPSYLMLQHEQPAGLRGRERPHNAIGETGLVQLVHLEVLQGLQMNLGPVALLGTNEVRQLTNLEQTRLLRQLELARVLNQRNGPHEVEQEVGPVVIGQVAGLQVIGTAIGPRDFNACCFHGPPEIPEQPLYLCKWVNTQSAQVGDVVTFYLKYSNLGGKPITDIVVADSLTGRLEYVPGSAKSDRNTVFTTRENEAGSLLLRWEVTGPLLPGQSGVVSFQARIR